MFDTEAARENAEKTRKLYESGLAPKVMAALAHPTDCRIVEAESLPFGGEYRGFEQFAALIKKMSAEFSATKIEYLGCSASADTAVAELVIHFTCAKSGRSFDAPVLELVRFREGKIVELRPYYWDTAAVLEALGEV